jgi:VWFA-related protein
MLGVTLLDAALGVALLAQASTGAATAAAGGPGEPTRFVSKTALVQVDVVVDDAQGKPVGDLTAQDFEFKEDGAPREIEMVKSISAAEPPPPAASAGQRFWSNAEGGGAGGTSVLVFDDLGLTPLEAEQARRAASDLLGRLQPGDSLGLATVSGRIWCTGRVPEDRAGLLAALKRLSGLRSQGALAADQMTEYEAERIVQYNDTLVLQRVENRLQRSQTQGPQPFQSDAASGISETRPERSPSGSASSGSSMNVDPGMLRANAGSLSSERQMAQSLATQLYARASERRGRLLQLLARVIDSLRVTEGRKAVVLMSARYLNGSDDRSYNAVRELARRAMVALYAVDVGGLTGGASGAGEQGGGDARLAMEERTALRAGLASLASDGGGFAITDSNDLAAGLQRISSDSRQYYLLGYRPPSAGIDGKYRQISVSVRRPGVSVRARPGYFATGDETTPAAGGERGETVRRALDSPFALPGIPLRLAAYSFEHTRAGGTRTQLVAELRVDGLSFEQKDGQFAADIDVLMGGLHYASGKTFGGKPVAARITARDDVRGRTVWYRLAQELELPAGACQVRFVVRDRKSGNVGSVIASLETPPEDDQWRTSSLVLSDAISSAGEGQPQHALPQARRTFPAAGLLYGEFEVYGAKADEKSGVPRVSAGYAILRKGGKLEREEALAPLEPTHERRFARLVTVPLGRLKAGDYEFVLKLKDEVSGKAHELHQPFTLVRPDRITSAVYQDLVQEYVAGRAAEALGELFAWRATDIAELVRELPAGDSALVHAAAMLHTEAVLTLMAQAQPARALAHQTIARELLARAEPRSPFRRDWLLALGALAQGSHADEEALQIYTECLEAFPSAAAAWLAAGTVYEYAAFPDGLRGGGLPGKPADLTREAERRYRQALVLDPTLAEAHLRLGRILMLTGRNDLALPELTRATDENAEPGLKGLAHLFLGDLCERQGRTDEALTHYRAARERDPALQQAALAEAALLERRDGRAAAVSALSSVLRGGCALGLPRWLGYHLGIGPRAETMLQELRRLVHS